MNRRLVFGGVLAGGAYLLAALLTSRAGLLPIRPLYDGLAPPAPYRYVSPPPDLADENEEPLSAVGTLVLSPLGSNARTVSTADGQMLVVFQEGAVPPRDGEDEVTVRITPIDPGPLPVSPEGLKLDGNAYTVRAFYSKSEVAADLRSTVTGVLRYPAHATLMLRQDGRSWTRLKTELAQASLQIFAETDELGTFIAAGPPQRSRGWIAYVAAAGGVLAGAAGYYTGRRRGRSRKGRPARRRRPG